MKRILSTGMLFVALSSFSVFAMANAGDGDGKKKCKKGKTECCKKMKSCEGKSAQMCHGKKEGESKSTSTEDKK